MLNYRTETGDETKDEHVKYFERSVAVYASDNNKTENGLRSKRRSSKLFFGLLIFFITKAHSVGGGGGRNLLHLEANKVGDECTRYLHTCCPHYFFLGCSTLQITDFRQSC